MLFSLKKALLQGSLLAAAASAAGSRPELLC